MPGRTIEELRDRVSGAVITPEDKDFEEARKVYNAMIDRHPRVVVRCSQAGDVAAAVDFARENELAVAGDEIPSWKPIGREGMVIGSQEIDRRGTRQDLTKLTLIRCNAVSHLSVGVEG